MKRKRITGNIYYLNYRYTDNFEVQYYTTDSLGRVVKWTRDDLEEAGFFCGFNRAVRLSAIKYYIFKPSPWKETYKDQQLRLYFTEENYKEDLKQLDTLFDTFSYDIVFFGNDCFNISDALKSVNEELANEMALSIELNKDEGRY